MLLRIGVGALRRFGVNRAAGHQEKKTEQEVGMSWMICTFSKRLAVEASKGATIGGWEWLGSVS